MSQFGELLEKLARADVRYVLVGGGAVLLHGYSRVTDDLDILIEATGRPKNVSDVAVLTEITYGQRGRQSVDLAAMEPDSAAGASEQGEWPLDSPKNDPTP